jgi:hypothetical protein
LDELRSVVEKSSVAEILKLSILNLINNTEIEGDKSFVSESEIILAIESTLSERPMTVDEAVHNLNLTLKPETPFMSLEIAQNIKKQAKLRKSRTDRAERFDPFAD